MPIDPQEWGALRQDVSHVRELLETHVAQSDLRYTDHEERIRSVERWKWGLPVTAILAVFGLSVGAAN